MHPEEYANLKASQTAQGAIGGCDVRPQTNYDNCLNQAQAVYKPPSLREQAEKNVGYHRAEADKHDRAAAFFRENPAFEEFIQLVRSGAIQF
jgi:hypothetical protein